MQLPFDYAARLLGYLNVTIQKVHTPAFLRCLPRATDQNLLTLLHAFRVADSECGAGSAVHHVPCLHPPGARYCAAVIRSVMTLSNASVADRRIKLSPTKS